MGLLDGFFSDDPRQQAQMALALGLLSGRGGKGFGGFARDLGSASMGAMQVYNQANALGDRRAEEAQQRKFRDLQMGEMQRGADFNAALSRGFTPGAPASQTFGPNDYETPSQFTPAKAPGFDFTEAMRVDPMRAWQAQQAMQKPAVAPIKIGEGDKLIDPNSYRTLAENPKVKDWQDPEWVKTQMAIRRAGKTDVTTNVMPPREVFKDSLGLKKDFDGQPEVKGFKEVQGAWDQISTALQKPSPANDMAAATKFMKLLDPGSVVRESELMMAMQASGALDRFMNTADRVLKGVKLTPQQREDFYKAGEALYQASLDRYGQTVQQYEVIADQYNLDKRFIQNAQPRKNNGGWSMQRVR